MAEQQGGTSSAAYVRWPDGRQSALTRTHISMEWMQRTGEVLSVLASEGLPVPRHELVLDLADGRLGGGAATPGRTSVETGRSSGCGCVDRGQREVRRGTRGALGPGPGRRACCNRAARRMGSCTGSCKRTATVLVGCHSGSARSGETSLEVAGDGLLHPVWATSCSTRVRLVVWCIGTGVRAAGVTGRAVEDDHERRL